MRKTIIKTGCLIVICGLGMGRVVQAEQAGTQTGTVTFEAGYRLDSVGWNIAGFNAGRTNADVNVLSELTWSDMNIAQVGIKNRIEIDHIYLRGRLSAGTIIDGDNQDSDYDYDNRQGEFSRSNNDAGGNVFDASAALGYRFDFPASGLHVAPLLSVAVHQQNLTMTNGYQTIKVDIPGGADSGGYAFAGLNSSYETEWRSVGAGVDAWQDVTQALTLSMSVEAQLADYSARANWNLRADFAHPVSFAHTADGLGLGLTLGAQYQLNDRSAFSVTFEYQSWTTEEGIDRVYGAAGGTAETPLNEANWESTALNVGLQRRF